VNPPLKPRRRRCEVKERALLDDPSSGQRRAIVDEIPSTIVEFTLR
jgi:hypothetical protein